MGGVGDIGRGRQRAILALASFAALMSSLDLNIVRLALPAMSADFHVDSGTVSWVQLVYALVLTCLLLVFGRLGDLWGYRPLFVGGLVAFTLGSLACALARGIGTLLLARAAQAVGGAAMMALTTPILSTFLPGPARGRAIGIAAGWESLGITLGRLLGGVIVEHLDWRWIFLINLPVGVLALPAALVVLPAGPPPAAGRRFDLGGAVLLFLALAPVLFGVSMGGRYGWSSPLITASFLTAAFGAAAFWALERRLREPLLDLSIFSNWDLVLAVLTSFVKFFIESGLYFLVPFYLMLSRQMSADLAGLLLVAPAVVQMAVSPATGWLTEQMGSRRVVFGSMAVTTLSCLLFYALTPSSPYALVVTAIASIGLAKGLFIAPNRHRMMASAPAHKMGAVNGVLETSTRAGLALGICVFEAAFSAALPGRGADYLHAPAAVLQEGFREAFLLGVLASLVGLASSAVSFRR